MLAGWLLETKLAAPADFSRIEAEARSEVEAAEAAALAAPYPDASEVNQHVYA